MKIIITREIWNAKSTWFKVESAMYLWISERIWNPLFSTILFSGSLIMESEIEFRKSTSSNIDCSDFLKSSPSTTCKKKKHQKQGIKKKYSAKKKGIYASGTWGKSLMKTKQERINRGWWIGFFAGLCSDVRMDIIEYFFWSHNLLCQNGYCRNNENRTRLRVPENGRNINIF